MSSAPLLKIEANKAGISEAARLLAAGKLVSFPTETVYGLGADALSDRAVARIFDAKGRPSFNPLIAHVSNAQAARTLCHFDETAERLAEAFWPGPLTLVLPLREGAGVSKLVTAGLSTLAVRVPAHPLARALLKVFAGPVAAPSANPSGRISPTTAAHVEAGLAGRIEAVLDGGACTVGLESTIVACVNAPVLLRAGGVPAELVEACLGSKLQTAESMESPVAPGQLASHYAPIGRVRLNATAAEPGEVMLGFGSMDADLSLSTSGDLTEAAARLFECLHTLDAMGATRIAVAPIPFEGLGLAINDRLKRAAAPR